MMQDGAAVSCPTVLQLAKITKAATSSSSSSAAAAAVPSKRAQNSSARHQDNQQTARSKISHSEKSKHTNAQEMMSRNSTQSVTSSRPMLKPSVSQPSQRHDTSVRSEMTVEPRLDESITRVGIVKSSTAALAVSAAAGDSSSPAVEVPSAPVRTAKITVRRATSVTTSPNTPPNQQPPRLSRPTSDVSDVSTTTPITPVPTSKLHPRRMRNRQPDDDSSSCSSTEALDERSTDDWNENPLYADQRRQRRRKSPAFRHARHVGTKTEVSTQPLDDLLAETESSDRQHFTQSTGELHRLTSPLAGATAGHSEVPPAMPLQASNFKSEPNVAVVHKTLIVQDSGNNLEACHGAMIDCISVEAPDDTVIKPSQLRASMRQRRGPPSTTSTDDSVVGRTVTGSPSADNSVDGGGTPWRRNVWRGRSLRETKRAAGVNLPVQKKAAVSTSSSCSSAVVTSASALQQDNGPSASGSRIAPPETTKSASNIISSSSAGPYTFSIPVSADAARKKVVQSPQQEVLPSFPRNSACSALSGKTNAGDVCDAGASNGIAYMSHDQLLREYKELRKKYDEQQEELRMLKLQADSKDSRIRSLEDELRSLQSPGVKPYHLRVKGVC